MIVVKVRLFEHYNYLCPCAIFWHLELQVQIPDLPNGEDPVSLQTTEASLLSHELAQIALHLPLMHSSTFPWLDVLVYLFNTRTDPCWHGPSNLCSERMQFCMLCMQFLEWGKVITYFKSQTLLLFIAYFTNTSRFENLKPVKWTLSLKYIVFTYVKSLWL